MMIKYHEKLGLSAEPFSTSPDPAFFYRTKEGEFAIKKLVSSIPGKKGLSVILGDVGTGKTTLSRILINQFAGEEYIVNMLLNPVFDSEYQFLSYLVKLFTGDKKPPGSSIDCQDILKDYLFEKGVNEGKIVVLFIDEGQKLTLPFLEILRILLNYETNEYKLLQTVIFSQTELSARLKRVKNFEDRISAKINLQPLDLKDTVNMIHFRLETAGGGKLKDLFRESLVKIIYEKSGGYPRRITMLCHDLLENMVLMNKKTPDAEVLKTVFPEEEI